MGRFGIENEPIEVTFIVTGVFEKLGVPYLIGGSLASTLYGMVRTTQDSDIFAEMHLEHIQPFVSALEADFYLDQEMIANSIQNNSSFNIIHRDTMFKVDVFIPRPRPYLKSQLARVRRQTFTFGKEVSAKFASPEDTILSKLEWFRMSGEGSDHQWRDILGVLKTKAGDLDLDYLRQWAKELKISDLFERAFAQGYS
jgi:hypothetical protein